ncbi:MAG: phosphatase PAP2 family protein [Lysobacter sp.]
MSASESAAHDVASPQPPAGEQVAWPRRLAIVAIALTLNSALYLGINAHPLRAPQTLPRSVVDDWLGWQAWTIWPYWLLLLAGPALTLAIRERHLLYATLRAYAVAIALNATIWLLWPTRIVRTALPHDLDAFTGAAWRVLYALDGINNCFPSGHITIPTVAAAGFAAQYPRMRPAVWIALALLAPSVISTGQHYLWDIVGGLATATFGLLLAGRPLWRSARP